jgi:cell division control protein 11
VNTLCGKKVLQGKDADDATNAHIEEGVRIKPITVGAHDDFYDTQGDTHTDCTAELELDEEGTRISLTIVDTPGFGDQIDNEAR